MKRIVQVFIAFIFIASVFATSKPSLDGRAVVADEGVLPRGLFAKTVGYLPGDSVSVTNPATGVTINVLVLGSIDPSTGVAILLSPEAADKLFITPNVNVQVKITKRTGLLDETAAGSAVLSSDPDKNAEDSIPAEIKETLDKKLTEVEPVESVATVEPEPEILPEPVVEPVESVATVEPEPEVLPEPVIEPVESVATVEPEPEVLPEPVIEPVESVATVEPEPEVLPEPVIEPVESVATVTADNSDENTDLEDPYAPIILIPVTDNPPKSTDIVLEPEPVVPIISEPEKSFASDLEQKKELSPVKPEVKTSNRNIVSSLSELESGKYYVQIATLAEEENIANLLEKYESKYPIVMVPLRSGSAYQIMVGPLTIDEYGTILARFKSFGYKDAFLRKIR